MVVFNRKKKNLCVARGVSFSVLFWCELFNGHIGCKNNLRFGNRVLHSDCCLLKNFPGWEKSTGKKIESSWRSDVLTFPTWESFQRNHCIRYVWKISLSLDLELLKLFLCCGLGAGTRKWQSVIWMKHRILPRPPEVFIIAGLMTFSKFFYCSEPENVSGPSELVFEWPLISPTTKRHLRDIQHQSAFLKELHLGRGHPWVSSRRSSRRRY